MQAIRGSSSTHHFSNHHDVWTSLLVNSQEVQESHIPEDDIKTINCPPRDKGFTSTQPQTEANKEGDNGQKVGQIKIVAEPHLNFLAYFACFRHKHLKNTHGMGVIHEKTGDEQTVSNKPNFLTGLLKHSNNIFHTSFAQTSRIFSMAEVKM